MRKFPQGSAFNGCSFENLGRGWLFNVALEIQPEKGIEETKASAIQKAKWLLGWLRRCRWLFRKKDNIQIIIYFPETVKQGGGQIIKVWVPASRLAQVSSETDPLKLNEMGGGGNGELPGWWIGIFVDS